MTQEQRAESKLLADFLQERFGMHFDGMRLSFLEMRLESRLECLHLENVGEYYRYLLYHPERDAEFERLKLLVTNNETFFFREHHQFETLVRHVVPEMETRGRKSLRVLSAGCSSGEEPYTLGITLFESAISMRGWEWQIDACDLNVDRLNTARSAVYERSSLRGCDDNVRLRYFDERDGKFALKPRYRANVRFFEANLASPDLGAGWGLYDAIFCRNVLIYFSDDAFRRTIASFAKLLVPNGYLFLGHSESLIGKGSAFGAHCVGGTIVYRLEKGAA